VAYEVCAGKSQITYVLSGLLEGREKIYNLESQGILRQDKRFVCNDALRAHKRSEAGFFSGNNEP
jgi:hypothetical protein